MATEKITLEKRPRPRFFYPYTLRELHNLGGTAHRNELKAAVLNVFDIGGMLPAGVAPKKKNQQVSHTIGWAMSWLSNGGYIDNPKRGYWSLSEKGKQALPRVIAALDESDDSAIQEFINEVNKAGDEDLWRRQAEKENADQPVQTNGDEGESNPAEEAIEKEEEKERVSLNADFLDAIKGMDAFAFERLCRKVLIEEGYKNTENTQKSHDRGIDGLGYLVFGLVRFKVVFSCKKFSGGTVGAGDMRDFIGAMLGANAHKGIFFTTASFSKGAENEAQNNGNVEMVDGKQLVALLKKHQIATKFVIDKDALGKF